MTRLKDDGFSWEVVAQNTPVPEGGKQAEIRNSEAVAVLEAELSTHSTSAGMFVCAQRYVREGLLTPLEVWKVLERTPAPEEPSDEQVERDAAEAQAEAAAFMEKNSLTLRELAYGPAMGREFPNEEPPTREEQILSELYKRAAAQKTVTAEVAAAWIMKLQDAISVMVHVQEENGARFDPKWLADPDFGLEDK